MIFVSPSTDLVMSRRHRTQLLFFKWRNLPTWPSWLFNIDDKSVVGSGQSRKDCIRGLSMVEEMIGSRVAQWKRETHWPSTLASQPIKKLPTFRPQRPHQVENDKGLP